MGYYEEKKKELEDLLLTIKKEKAYFENAAKQERQELNQKIAWNKKLEEGVNQMAKERQIGFPWLAKAYDELFHLKNYNIANFLKNKKHPAVSAAEIVKEQSLLRRQAEKEKRIAQYLVEYYESIAPFLIDLKDEVNVATEQERELLKDYSEEELNDETTRYLSKEEYRKLSSIENRPDISVRVFIFILKNGSEELKYMFFINRSKFRPVFALYNNKIVAFPANQIPA